MAKSIFKDVVKYIIVFFIFYLLSVAYVKNNLKIFALGFAGSLMLLAKDSFVFAIVFVVANFLATFSFVEVLTSVAFVAIIILGKLISNRLNQKHNCALSSFYFIVGCMPKFFFLFNGDIPKGIIFVLLSSGVFVASFIFCSAVIRRKMYLKLTIDEIACGLVVVIGLFCGLYQISNYYLDFVRLVATLALLMCVYCELDILALCLGTIFGLGVTLAGGGIGYIAMFSVMAILVKLFKSNIKLFSALACVGIDVVFGLYFEVFDFYSVYNVIASIVGGGIFMVLPKKFFDYVVVNYSKPSTKMAYKSIINQNSSEISKKLLELSEVFFDMDLGFRKLVRGNLPLDESKKMFIGEVRDNCCVDCDNYVDCHRRNFEETEKVFKGLADTGFEKGKVTLLELPPYLTAKCNKINVMLPTINGLINQYKKNAQVTILEDDSKILVAEQLRGVSKLLYDLSQVAGEKLVFDTKKEVEIIEELTYNDIICCEASVYIKDKDNFKIGVVIRKEDLQNDKLMPSIEKVCKHKLSVVSTAPALVAGLAVMELESAPAYDIVFGVARAAKNNMDNCGDNYSMLKISKNKFLLAICDGMGSGEVANDISQKASNLIENFYRAEFDSEIILGSINKLLNLQRGDVFSTIDICVVDIATSLVDFVKLGATASFIKHKDTITKIESGALPIGVLEDISPKITKTSISQGDMVILTSDGIADSFGEDMLESFILENKALSPQELADSILEKSKSLCGGVPNDDMTVVVGKIFKNA